MPAFYKAQKSLIEKRKYIFARNFRARYRLVTTTLLPAASPPPAAAAAAAATRSLNQHLQRRHVRVIN